MASQTIFISDASFKSSSVFDTTDLEGPQLGEYTAPSLNAPDQADYTHIMFGTNEYTLNKKIMMLLLSEID